MSNSTSQFDWTNARLGVVGFGNMGSAIILGALDAGLLGPSRISAFDKYASALAEFPGMAFDSISGIASDVDVLLVAVKPYQIEAVLAEVAASDNPPSVVISVAAGVSLAKLRAAVKERSTVVRVMPNTAAAVGFSTSAVVADEDADPAHVDAVVQLFNHVGIVVRLPQESDMHAFTAIAGSGPAFAYVFAEALADGAVSQGMARPMARRAAAAMLRGAAEMLLDSGISPAELKDRVTSPGGTTIEGVIALEAGGFRYAAADAVRTAAERSREMSK